MEPETVVIEDNEIDADENPHEKPTVTRKRKKLTADCWNHMKEFTDVDGKRKGRCNYCGAVLIAQSGTNGTSSLNKHVKNCRKNPANLAKDQPNLVVNKNEDGQGTLKSWKFDAANVRRLLTKMVIVDELPFCFVEREGFREFMESLCPNFKIPSRFTVARDILDLYLDEKQKLRNFFIKNKQRVSFTTDTWTSVQRINYMCLTVHFIDDNWKYHKRIINFKPIYSHKGENIAEALLEFFDEWGIQRVMTITMDNASPNDVAVGILKYKLPNLIDNGKYLHVRCVAHIINLIVQDGLKVQNGTVDCIRDAVKHIRSSPMRLEKFKTCVTAAKIETKGLFTLDVSTRWKSTYDMLERAIQLEKAIDLYGRKEASVRNEFPTRCQWDFARKTAEILQVFKRKTVDLSCSNYVIAHEVYAEVIDIGDNLVQIYNEKDQHFEFLEMVIKMRAKFDKYYEDEDGNKSNKLFEFAAILDPRVKLTIIYYGCAKTCESMKKAGLLKTNEEFKDKVQEMVDGVKLEMQLLLREYEDLDEVGSSIPMSTGTGVENGETKKTWMGKLEKFCGVAGQSSSKRTDFERYLLEDREAMTPKFDILLWWKVNSTRYPTLARMARDILAIPVSTVASESAFSTGGRVVEAYRSSLSPTIVEALICTQDWIRDGRKEINEEEKDEKFDEFAKDVFEKVEKMKLE